jgi:hypothetical protein
MTREEAKAEIKLSILSSWEQHFDQDAKDAIRRMEMIIDRIYDGFVGHKVKFRGDFKEPNLRIDDEFKKLKAEFHEGIEELKEILNS